MGSIGNAKSWKFLPDNKTDITGRFYTRGELRVDDALYGNRYHQLRVGCIPLDQAAYLGALTDKGDGRGKKISGGYARLP